jgi:hypothetical protein
VCQLVSHGRDAFLARLSSHHRRAAVLSADAIVAFLHHAYLEAEADLARTREPYERFHNFHNLIDDSVSMEARVDEDGDLVVTLILPTGDLIPIKASPRRLLYQMDRQAYIEALNAARSVPSEPVEAE